MNSRNVVVALASLLVACSGNSGTKGDKGEPGLQGDQGIQGPQGPPGPEGPAGAAGAVGAVGKVGPAGATGPAGASGPAGPAGPTGAVGPAGPTDSPDVVLAKVNTALKNGGSLGELASAVSAENFSAAFTSQSKIFVKVPYGAVAYDRRGEFSAGRFTAQRAGDYLVCASLWTGGVPLNIEIDIFKNAVREKGIAAVRGSHVVSGCRPVRLLANDYIEVHTWQDSGGPVTIPLNAEWQWLTIHQTR